MKTASTGVRAATQGRFLALDALRGFAAIAVALFHFNPALLPGGYLAVDFFFALSGFVLANSYSHRFAAGLSAWQFIRMRVARLLPLHLVGVGFGAALALLAFARHRPWRFGIVEFGWAAALNPLMLPSPFSPKLFPLNNPAWSLMFEMVANIAMALFLIRLRVRGLLVVVATAAVILFVSVGFAPYVSSTPLSPDSAMAGGFDWRTIGIGFARTSFSFSLGMVLAYLPRAEARVERIWALPCCVLLVILLAIPVSSPARLAYDLAVVYLASPLLIYGCSRFETDRRFAPVAAFVGELSFALYAVHYPLHNAFEAIENQTHLSNLVLAIAFLATSLLLAWGAVRWIDIPARRYLGRLITR